MVSTNMNISTIELKSVNLPNLKEELQDRFLGKPKTPDTQEEIESFIKGYIGSWASQHSLNKTVADEVVDLILKSFTYW